MTKILIAPTSFCVSNSLPEDRLKEHGYDLVKNPYGRKLSAKELVELGKDCVGVIAGTEEYTRDVLSQLPLLRMISRVGVGMDNIDITNAQERQIKVCPTITTPSSAVAELTLGLILDVLRKISHQNSLLKAGKWEKSLGGLLEGRCLGIIGLGKIGKRLVHLTKPFGLKYLACDLKPDRAFAHENGVEFCEIDSLLAKSDVVSIHLSSSPDARALIDISKFKLMKQHAIIVNTSRGHVIHEKSLISALKEKLIAGAALDVFEQEPYHGLLLGFDNVIVTPHIGAYAEEVRNKMELESVENLISGLGVIDAHFSGTNGRKA